MKHIKLTPKAFIALSGKATRILLKTYNKINNTKDTKIIKQEIEKMHKRLDYLERNPNTKDVYLWTICKPRNIDIQEEIAMTAYYIEDTANKQTEYDDHDYPF